MIMVTLDYLLFGGNNNTLRTLTYFENCIHLHSALHLSLGVTVKIM